MYPARTALQLPYISSPIKEATPLGRRQSLRRCAPRRIVLKTRRTKRSTESRPQNTTADTKVAIDIKAMSNVVGQTRTQLQNTISVVRLQSASAPNESETNHSGLISRSRNFCRLLSTFQVDDTALYMLRIVRAAIAHAVSCSFDRRARFRAFRHCTSASRAVGRKRRRRIKDNATLARCNQYALAQ